MKDRYFLVVVSALVCTVWSEAESQDCNNTEEMTKCVKPIQDLTVDREFGLSMSREKLERVCPVLNQVLRCIDSYTARCITEEVLHHSQNLFHPAAEFLKKVCHPGPYQEEFLIHAPCMSQVSDDIEHCVHQYQQKIGEDRAKMKDRERMAAKETSAENDSDLRTACCSFRDYLVCTQSVVMEKCGEQTAKFTEDMLNQMTSSLIKTHCESYLHGSDQCQGSSASQNSPRALLLPVSVAMISLHALRPT